MQGYNPFQPPIAAGTQPSQTASAPLTAIAEALRETRPWVKFLAVLGYIGAGLSVLLGFFTMATGLVSGALRSGPLGGLTPLLGLFYIAFGAVYAVPSTLLWRYGASISNFVERGELEALVDPIVRQKSFWRFAGIMTVVMLVVYAFAIVGGIIIGVATATSH